MANENDVNAANLNDSSFINGQFGDDKDNSQLHERSKLERKETRRLYRSLIEDTAKFDELEPNEVSLKTFHKKS